MAKRPLIININIKFFLYCADPYCKSEGALQSLYHVLFGAVCTIEKKGFQSSAESICRSCSWAEIEIVLFSSLCLLAILSKR